MIEVVADVTGEIPVLVECAVIGSIMVFILWCIYGKEFEGAD